jgi:hypothetical protein
LEWIKNQVQTGGVIATVEQPGVERQGSSEEIRLQGADKTVATELSLDEVE